MSTIYEAMSPGGHEAYAASIFSKIKTYLDSNPYGYITSYKDTKNTAGSTNTSSKIFLIGATSQAANPQTYSHDTAYVGTDGCLYSGGTKVLTAHQSVTDNNPTLSWGTKSKVATIGGTAINVTMPSNPNTDANVTQTATDASSNAEYEILFSETADNTTRTEGARKTSQFTFNPQTNQVTAGHFAAVSGSPSGTKTAYLIGYDVKLEGTSNTWDGTHTSLTATISSLKQSLSQLKHVPITTATATFPSTVSIQGDNYYQKNGRLVIVIVNLKIVSSTKGWHRVTNYIPNIVDRPIYNIPGNASDGDTDGIMQPFNITSQGVLEIYNTKTGTTYCQGSVAYFANDLG